MEEINEMIAEREAKARATILEMVGDIPDVDVAPPENVLFVCKLNPVTTDDDLEIIFSRFGKIKSCEVIRDRKTGDSLQYAFVEFEEQKSCEDAYFKMDNVLIDDRRIHVDFSQSVAKVKWHGKGRGVTHYDDRGRKTERGDRDIGKGSYKISKKTEYERDDDNKLRRYSGRDRREERRDRQKHDSDFNYSKRKENRSTYRSRSDEKRRKRSRSRSRDRRDRTNRDDRRSSRKRQETDQRSDRSSSRDRERRRESKKRSHKDKKKHKRRRESSSD